MSAQGSDLLASLLAPRRVAILAGSGRVGELLRRNLADRSGAVEFWPAPPQDGAAPWPPGQDVVDLAVVALPAAAVPAALARLPVGRLHAAVVLAGGFGETGPEGAALQERLTDAARVAGVRLVGPNCFGVLDPSRPLNASLGRPLPEQRRPGTVAVVTQSGAYAMTAAALVRDGHPIGKVVSVGNEADVTSTELLGLLGCDAASQVLCFLLEQMHRPREFVDQARRITRDKPVVVLRTGRTADGGRAAGSHTAALATDGRVADAVLRRAGVLCVRSGRELFDTAAALALQPVPAGSRAGIVTNSGGLAVELTDLLAGAGVTVPELSPGLQERMRALLPPYGSPRNPVDVTTAWDRFATAYPGATELLARSGEVDLVIPVLVHRAAEDSGVAAGLAGVVGRLRADDVPVPVYGCWLADPGPTVTRTAFADAGIPLLDWADRTAAAVGHAVAYGRTRARLRERGADPSPRPLQPVSRDGRPEGWLLPEEAGALLTAAGICLAPYAVCATAQEAGAEAARLGSAVTLKVVHPMIVHKSEVGGVRVGVPVHEAAATAAELLALADGARVLVQPVVTGGPELMIGGRQDAVFGPVVAVGLGGVLVEVLDDVALGTAPLHRHEAQELLRSLRSYPALAGARGAAPVDEQALAAVIIRIGDLLAGAPWISEIDLNPVIPGDGRVQAVDWRVRIGPAGRGTEGCSSHGDEESPSGPA